MIGLEYYYPTEEQISVMGKISYFSRSNKLMYREEDDGYLAYHPTCGRKGKISKKTFKQARGTHLCPFCFSEIKSTTKENKQTGFNFVRFGSLAESYGYYVLYEYNIDKEPFADCDQIYYASGNDCYHRYVGFDMFAHNLTLRTDRPDWKYSKRSNWSNYTYQERHSYEECMWDYDYCKERYISESTKRQYLEKEASYIVKSNQKKILMDNLLSRSQMEFIKVFDIKNMEDVVDNKAFIGKYHNHFYEFIRDGIVLNTYYLDYLKRNKIDLGTYYEYIHNQLTLGFKLDKPTDFEHRLEVSREMMKAEEDKRLNIKIAERYEELPKYEKENVTISPFKSSQEIRDCGKTLHNCIGGYVKKYADKTNDIYHLDLDGAITIALEITGNRLIQAHSDHNKECPANLFEHIKTFCTTNGFELGRYA